MFILARPLYPLTKKAQIQVIPPASPPGAFESGLGKTYPLRPLSGGGGGAGWRGRGMGDEEGDWGCSLLAWQTQGNCSSHSELSMTVRPQTTRLHIRTVLPHRTVTQKPHPFIPHHQHESPTNPPQTNTIDQVQKCDWEHLFLLALSSGFVYGVRFIKNGIGFG